MNLPLCKLFAFARAQRAIAVNLKVRRTVLTHRLFSVKAMLNFNFMLHSLCLSFRKRNN